MTKNAWLEHMEFIGLRRQPMDMTNHQWIAAVKEHSKDCPVCQARAKTRRANKARRAKDDAYRSCGMTKVRGELGGTYWESEPRD